MSSLLFSALSAVIAGLSAWQLTTRPLWSYWSLLFWVSLWSTILCIWHHRLQRHKPTHTHYLYYALLSGVLLSIGFPPFPFFPFIWLGWVPLFWVHAHLAQTAQRGFGKYAFASLLTWNILTTYWVTNSAFVAGAFSMLPNTLLMCIPWLLFSWAYRKLPNAWAYVAFICFWMGFEYIHLQWEISWPWLTLGNSYAVFPQIFQWYEWTGVSGGTLWTLLLNILLLYAFKAYKQRQQATERSYLLRAAVVAFVPLVLSLGRYYTYQTASKHTAKVAIVQPNYEPHYEKFDIPQVVQLRRFLDLSEQALTPDCDYLLYPETSFEGITANNMKASPLIQQLIAFVHRYPRLHLVTGLSSYRKYAEGEQPPTSARLYEGRGTAFYYDSHNSAIQISSYLDDTIPYYIKSKLVPGVEMIPYLRYTKILAPIAQSVGGSSGSLGTQPERSVFWSHDGQHAVAPVICYESIYGAYVTEYIRKGANALFIGTNDGWWDNTAGYRQHLVFASLRAVETRRSIARSANTGSSAFINERGDVLQATPYRIDTTIVGRITLNAVMTFYTCWGDYLYQLALLLSGLAILVIGYLSFRKM
jgi:apolipoprotein N-acyltransferase